MTTQPEPTPPGLYQHYKGPLYEVTGTAHHVESGEPLVVYRSTSGQAWARPAADFNGTVDGGPRFTRIGPPAAAARPDPACVIPGTCTHCGQPARAVTTWQHTPIRDDCQDPAATFQPGAAPQPADGTGLYDKIVAMFGGPLPWPAPATPICGAPGPWGDAHACIKPAAHPDAHRAHDGCGWHDKPEPGPAATQATEPREHCGNLKPQFSESTERTECVLRPGHTGSHADHNNTRWWWTDEAIETRPADTEPAMITDPAYLRRLYTAAIRDTPARYPDDIAAAVMRVRDGYVAQLVQRLRIADQMQADYEERVVGDLNEKNIALARQAGLAQQRADQLAAVLREVLGEFRVNTHPGEACLTTYNIPVARVQEWRAALDQHQEQPHV